MSNPKPNITVPVDLTNPGQFFACCGLLELADRLWPGAEGWFDKQQFRLWFAGSISDLLLRVIMDPPVELAHISNDLTVRPIIAPLAVILDGGALRPVILDFWVRASLQQGQIQAVGNTPWNLWSGQQTPFRIWEQLRTALRVIVSGMNGTDDSVDIFNNVMPLTGRFGFDSAAAWKAQDLGFSPNTQGMAVDSSPATELLAAIGLQRFRPRRLAKEGAFSYSTWPEPASPMIASAASCGAIGSEGSTYKFEINSRGQYAAFGTATPIQGDLHNV